MPLYVHGGGHHTNKQRTDSPVNTPPSGHHNRFGTAATVANVDSDRRASSFDRVENLRIPVAVAATTGIPYVPVWDA